MVSLDGEDGSDGATVKMENGGDAVVTRSVHNRTQGVSLAVKVCGTLAQLWRFYWKVIPFTCAKEGLPE